ncbi:uncharacterized protein MONOS_10943 [Monocercomonoides exilis]|uniref:uncharacterized protein n=1 Tax=Monocercomonoides exilis TaxID=2049356 RepID=UPI003559BD44|nr:hypothetical protein MONOS_10943 [Monocercomonoides exilis]|eukprot:MONOS_10943.1-p1 / transcript=MONOS_10943.1 / gene=MONOS_10943 / organism=Monocercomonoides_exilis_PA203 / gene_product=unspecified product / transcript_product=unspecified product / location=Mono_scaffold00520:32219-32782(-) / protein_length=188 / sequence_SO=supercontig / SO=protein_coding / is_pseudo=false
MEDIVQSHAAIVQAVLEEREEAEEGEKGGKEGEEKGEEDGGREGGDGNEEKGGYPAAHREFVERIKENQGKLEEAMAPLIVEALGLRRLRFVKEKIWIVISSESGISQMLYYALTMLVYCVTLDYASNKNFAAGEADECYSFSSMNCTIEMIRDAELLKISVDHLTIIEEKDKLDEEAKGKKLLVLC